MCAVFGRKQYRITFDERVLERLSDASDALELSWLLSKHDLEVVGRSEAPHILFVQTDDHDDLLRFLRDVDVACHAKAWESVDESVPGTGYVPAGVHPPMGVRDDDAPDWESMFRGLVGYLARTASTGDDDPLSLRSARADACHVAYAYAQGVAEARGVDLPDLGGEPGAGE